MTATESITIKNIQSFTPKGITEREDQLAIEEPLEIRLSYVSGEKTVRKSISVTMRTPGADEELAVGFLFTEGIIRHQSQVRSITIPDDNIVVVHLDDNAVPLLPETERNFYTTSSCGVCGKSSIDAITTVSQYTGNDKAIRATSSLLLQLTDELNRQQQVFQHTGGLHASALFDIAGNLLIVREDVGRHNALDKAIGALFLNDQLPLSDKILLLSGRSSFELIQKAAMAGIPIVAAIGAPSSLAVQLAEESGITLIGFLRKESFNIYTGSERITDI